MKKRIENKGKTRKVLLTMLCIFLGLILVMMLAATIYMERLLNLINRVEPDNTQATLSSSDAQAFLENEKDETDPNYTGPTMNAEDVTWATDPTEPVETGENIVNILLIGQDRREGEIRSRSDAMILCTVNKAEKTLTMTSIMRDLYVQIPGYSDNRINVCYALGGMQLLNECIEKNFGVAVDGNVEVDFAGFETVIDLVGGVDIELAGSEAQHLNSKNSSWNLVKGVNHLNGEQALTYARIRSVIVDEVGDFGRTSRQRTVLTKLVEQAKTMSLAQLNNLLTQVLPTITTDLTDAEIFGYAVELFPLLADITIETGRVPADGAYYQTMIDGNSVIIPDLEKNRQLLQEIMAD